MLKERLPIEQYVLIPEFSIRVPPPFKFMGTQFNPIISDWDIEQTKLLFAATEICELRMGTPDLQEKMEFADKAIGHLVQAAFLEGQAAKDTIIGLQTKFYEATLENDEKESSQLKSIVREAIVAVTALLNGYDVYPTVSDWDLHKGIDIFLIKNGKCLAVDVKNNKVAQQNHANDHLPVWNVGVPARPIGNKNDYPVLYTFPFESEPNTYQQSSNISRQIAEGMKKVGISLKQ
ncbi:hypothetical protein BH09PAT2_BH09PAT2_00680 [soil metagenome]